MRRLLVCLLVVIAGCAAAPTTDPPADVTVSLSATNAGDSPHVVTFGVVPGNVEGYRVTYADNSTETYADTTTIDDLPPRAVADAVSIVPLADDARTRRFDLRPGEGVGASISSFPRNATVYYTVADPTEEAPLRTFGAATCGAGATSFDVEVVIRAGGYIDAGTTCSDRTETAAS